MKNFRLPAFANRFDVIRLILASLVIISHTPELADGNRSRELLTSVFHTLSFGEVGVDGFFVVSGYLILQSWVREPDILRFLQKRILRIYPAFIVASLVCLLVIGPLAGGVGYWGEIWIHGVLKNIIFLRPTLTPPVFEGTPYPYINGAMWTVSYEFICYLMVAALGIVFHKRLRFAWTLLAAAFCTLYLYAQVSHGAVRFQTHVANTVVLKPYLRFGMLYTMGGALYLWRDLIPKNRGAFLVSTAALLMGMFFEWSAEWVFAIFGGFILTSFGGTRSDGYKIPDVSYGLYLYGWPVIKIILFFGIIKNVCIAAVGALLASTLLGFISWELIEKRCLRAKNYDIHIRWMQNAINSLGSNFR